MTKTYEQHDDIRTATARAVACSAWFGGTAELKNMDKQNRLTKWAEWVIGGRYEWVKGKTVLGPYLCVTAHEADGCVRIQTPHGEAVKTFSWRNRYRRVVPPNDKLTP